MLKNELDREVVVTKVFFVFTFIFSGLFFYQLTSYLVSNFSLLRKSDILIICVYILISFFIIYGNVIYHLTRIGYFSRLKKHPKAKFVELENFFLKDSPLVTFLIPSYKEEIKVITQTLWSAALQYYPNKRVVLLIDNPPDTEDVDDQKLLNDTRKLVINLQNLFIEISDVINLKYQGFKVRSEKSNLNFGLEMERLEKLCNRIALWFEKNMIEADKNSHVDNFFGKEICGKWIKHLKENIRKAASSKPESADSRMFLDEQYKKLIKLLSVEFEYFERKTFVNLSHEPNKAMNINSYLHLIGKRVRVFEVNGERHLEATMDPQVDTIIPDSKYIVTLDADSMLKHDYTIKLVNEMEKAENEKVAVMQTPYSAYPGANTPIEIVAGATTDIQYNIHQGFTYYNSTYWVGANALLRHTAMEDIKMYEIQGNKVAAKYVQDRTVIEDTESSIDLVDKGWKLLNIPERLAFSSTPSDFGSLIIQRQRWANGGLIIFPKLLKYILKKPFDPKRWVEFIVRSNYLVSIAGINIGILLLLLYPFSDNIFTLWLPLASIPYYALYTKDLKSMGYKVTDIVRVYSLNLILIPINIAGVLMSIYQGIANKKIPFKRTPKIGNRVAAEIKFILFLYLLLFYTSYVTVMDAINGHWSHVVYTGLNGLLLLYALKTFVGFKESWLDIKSQLPPVKKPNYPEVAQTNLKPSVG